MKHFKNFIFFILMVLSTVSLGQNECKVLVPEISENYEGKCKKGFAHGKGTASGIDNYTGRFVKGLPGGKGVYTWANGDIYTGYWEKGKRNGEGSFRFKINDKDSLLSGIWEFDKYIGPIPEKPKVKYKKSVERYTFSKLNDIYNKIEIQLMCNGMRNPTVSDLTIHASTGIVSNLTIEDIQYPVTVKIQYNTASKLNTYMYPVIFEFEISDPGEWLLIINN